MDSENDSSDFNTIENIKYLTESGEIKEGKVSLTNGILIFEAPDMRIDLDLNDVSAYGASSGEHEKNGLNLPSFQIFESADKDDNSSEGEATRHIFFSESAEKGNNILTSL